MLLLSSFTKKRKEKQKQNQTSDWSAELKKLMVLKFCKKHQSPMCQSTISSFSEKSSFIFVSLHEAIKLREFDCTPPLCESDENLANTKSFQQNDNSDRIKLHGLGLGLGF